MQSKGGFTLKKYVSNYNEENMQANIVEDNHNEEIAAEFTPNEPNVSNGFGEETAAEIMPDDMVAETYHGVEEVVDKSGSAMGYIGIILAVLSFFWLPWLFAAGAVIFGMISAMRRDVALGVTALVIGSASLIVQMFYYFGFWY